MFNIYEVMEYGPVIAHDEDLQLIVTVNGAYLNLWIEGARIGHFENVDVQALNSENGLHGLDIVKAIKQAEDFLKEKVKELYQ